MNKKMSVIIGVVLVLLGIGISSFMYFSGDVAEDVYYAVEDTRNLYGQVLDIMIFDLTVYGKIYRTQELSNLVGEGKAIFRNTKKAPRQAQNKLDDWREQGLVVFGDLESAIWNGGRLGLADGVSLEWVRVGYELQDLVEGK